MNSSQITGFEEVEHTADWELKVWANDLPGLLENAARGMYHLAGLELGADAGINRCLTIGGDDNETLLVEFLAELLWILENENLAFDVFKLIITDNQLKAELEGARILNMVKEIKAVTYNNIRILITAEGYEVQIVFDV